MDQGGLKWSEHVLLGSHSAKIDDKGRLKVPSMFRAFIEEQFGRELFVTSLTGEWVLLYPITAWKDIQPHLVELPNALRKLSYYGQVGEIDKQGRVLIHPRLRDSALITAEVEVIGQHNHLEVWNHERYVATLGAAPYSEEERRGLRKLGLGI